MARSVATELNRTFIISKNSIQFNSIHDQEGELPDSGFLESSFYQQYCLFSPMING